MPAVTREELVALLLAVRGSTFVTLTTYTQPEMRAYDGERILIGREKRKNVWQDNRVRNPYYQRAWKRAKVNGAVGFWYGNAVNNQRFREDKDADFESLEHAFHVHIPGSPVTVHADDPSRLYLPVLHPASLGYQYEVDGEVIDKELINPWLRQKTEGERQQLDKPRIYREYRLDHITDVSINGAWYEVEHPDAVRAG